MSVRVKPETAERPGPSSGRGRADGGPAPDAGASDAAGAWRALLRRAGRAPLAGAAAPPPTAAAPDPGDADELGAVFGPLCDPPGRPLVIAHLGQSLDGRIATLCGASRWVTGPSDIRHTHRLRALSDAVIVGAGTVRHDDPRLTVREAEGRHPVRVILDPRRRLGDGYGVFQDGAAETLLLVRAGMGGGRHGLAEVVEVPGEGPDLDPRAVRAVLGRRGLHRLFVEGGGVTVSRFLQAGVLDRLHVAVAPLLIGSGRPSLDLPVVDDLAGCRRPATRVFRLGADVLFDCAFDSSASDAPASDA